MKKNWRLTGGLLVTVAMWLAFMWRRLHLLIMRLN